MMKLPISAAAAALLRSLLARAGVDRDRILLMDFRSVNWQSLTFDGERHEIDLRIPGPGASAIADALVSGVEEHEFDLAGHFVADIGVADRWDGEDGKATTLRIEALTVAD